MPRQEPPFDAIGNAVVRETSCWNLVHEGGGWIPSLGARVENSDSSLGQFAVRTGRFPTRYLM